MKKILALITALLLAAPAHAQFSVGGGGPKAGPTVPSYAMPAGKIYVDVSKLPKRRYGYSTNRYIASGCTTSGYNGSNATKWPTSSGSGAVNCNSANSPTVGSGGGAFRMFCGLSHVGFDDPIVWPRQAGRTHLHAFYGNTSTGPNSDVASMDTTGDSTCEGGLLNRTGYWAPPLIYHRPGNARDGEPQIARRFNAYYKTLDETHGPIPQWPPKGLRMIAGDPTNTNPANLGDYAYFECWVNGQPPPGANPFTGTPNSYRFNHLPSTADGLALSTASGQGSVGCTTILMEVVLPACMLNTLDLDSPDHKSHMAYAAPSGPSGPAGKEGCVTPGYQGRQIPEISVLIHTPVVNADLDFIRLSSDLPKAQVIASGLSCATAQYNYCAGQSIHADWVNGWNQTTIVNAFNENITDLIRRECYYVASSAFRSCSDGVLGDKDKNGTYWIMY